MTASGRAAIQEELSGVRNSWLGSCGADVPDFCSWPRARCTSGRPGAAVDPSPVQCPVECLEQHLQRLCVSVTGQIGRRGRQVVRCPAAGEPGPGEPGYRLVVGVPALLAGVGPVGIGPVGGGVQDAQQGRRAGPTQLGQQVTCRAAPGAAQFNNAHLEYYPPKTSRRRPANNAGTTRTGDRSESQ